MGETSGGVERMTPVRPDALIRAKEGRSPFCTSGSIASQSAASIPISTTGGEVGRALGPGGPGFDPHVASAHAHGTVHGRQLDACRSLAQMGSARFGAIVLTPALSVAGPGRVTARLQLDA